jgi:hypothetical protein
MENDSQKCHIRDVCTAANKDMFLNIPLIADWHAITQKREHLIPENLIREDQKRRWYDYLPEQRILKKALETV